ncbi:MAG: hypothetical protein LUE22_06480 [Oscillospiraceae bacterium]|nr:hypothetical protein [Oscillospiraceae bacterium]
MSMESFEKIREKLCLELEELAHKELGVGDLEILHKLTDTLKNIDKIEMLESEEGYSQRGYSRESGNSQRGSYSRGNSYANRGEHYVRGHYSRNGYSRSGMMEHLERLMDEADTKQEREAIRRCMEQIDE